MFLDVFLWLNFIIHQIGSVLVAMNLGLSSNLIELCVDIKNIIYFSLPYLDPTDPFFQKVGVELLNEVCNLKLHIIIDFVIIDNHSTQYNFTLLCL